MGQTKGYTPAQWDAIEKDYIEGGGKIPALCEKHSMNFHTVAARARAGRWGTRRRLYSEQVRNPVPPGPQFSVMMPAHPGNSQITPAFFIKAQEDYYARIPEVARMLDDLRERYFDSTYGPDAVGYIGAYRSLLEASRILNGVPLRAPIKSTERVARRANIVPLDVEPAADAAQDVGSKSDANGTETPDQSASG